MVEQQRTAAADQSLAIKQIELDVVDQQIKKAIDAWRERAAVSLFLERIRVEYEQNRQPETLREASEYMSQLTDGKYTRIWTPLAHDILFVDSADGGALPVQVLSRGTREQLFVSLRLALVSAYARRGIHLPMILDDVFVNFDAGRTKTACSVLREFAKQGHQLLVFTCHEHVWRMFQEIKVDCRRIPNRHGEIEEEAQPEPVPERVVAVVAPPAPEPVQPELEPAASVPEPIVIKQKIKRRVVEPPVKALGVATEEVRQEPIQEPSPSVHEIEYWWESPHSRVANGDSHVHERNGDDDVASDWSPETEIERHHW